MGILDEAIREHLELKRQHGAGDSELQQLEDDAFGPPARPGAAPSDAVVAEAPGAVDDEAATTVQPAEPAEPLPEPAQEEQPAIEHRVIEPDAADAETVRAETEEHPPPEPPEAPELREPVEKTVEASIADQPTEFYDVEGEQPPVEDEEPVEDEFFSEQSLSDELDQALDAPETEQAPAPDVTEAPDPESDEEELPAENEGDGNDSEEEGEDVLEETPEFLQDSPEHDRLWFEQKPPKDFDFDD
jgi:hypothetical protein